MNCNQVHFPENNERLSKQRLKEYFLIIPRKIFAENGAPKRGSFLKVARKQSYVWRTHFEMEYVSGKKRSRFECTSRPKGALAKLTRKQL